MLVWRELWRQFVSYTVVSTTVTVLEFTALNVLLFLFPTTIPILLTLYSVSAYALSIAMGYRWHRRWTFPRGRRQRQILRRFVFLNVVTLGVNATAVLLCTLTLPTLLHFDTVIIANISKGLASLISGTMNFLGNRIWVFQATALPAPMVGRNRPRRDVLR